MNDYLLYENAMQVVPLLLIALFLDRQSPSEGLGSPKARPWLRRQDQAIAALGFIAFFVSMFVVAQIIEPSSLTLALVISALSGAVGLLLGLIWSRFGVRT